MVFGCVPPTHKNHHDYITKGFKSRSFYELDAKSFPDRQIYTTTTMANNATFNFCLTDQLFAELISIIRLGSIRTTSGDCVRRYMSVSIVIVHIQFHKTVSTHRVPSGINMCLSFMSSILSTSKCDASKLFLVNNFSTNDAIRRCKPYTS